MNVLVKSVAGVAAAVASCIPGCKADPPPAPEPPPTTIAPEPEPNPGNPVQACNDPSIPAEPPGPTVVKG